MGYLRSAALCCIRETRRQALRMQGGETSPVGQCSTDLAGVSVCGRRCVWGLGGHPLRYRGLTQVRAANIFGGVRGQRDRSSAGCAARGSWRLACELVGGRHGSGVLAGGDQGGRLEACPDGFDARSVAGGSREHQQSDVQGAFKSCPNPTKFGLNSAHIDQIRPESARVGAISTKAGPQTTKPCRTLCQTWRDFDQP